MGANPQFSAELDVTGKCNIEERRWGMYAQVECSICSRALRNTKSGGLEYDEKIKNR